MNEIYWITRFSSLHNAFGAILITSLVIICIALCAYVGGHCEKDKDLETFALKFIKIFGSLLILGGLGTTFIPTTSEAFLIYGVGGTVDYIKANPTAKHLPDKCIKALDKWVDTWFVEENDSTQNKK